MGLSERKTKQRLGADPRNLTWANDTSRFGQQYLEKFGWTAGSGAGLGVSGQGRIAHLSVAQKLDLLGIGGARSGSSGDVSWTQNRDYEAMLRRLNAPPGDGKGQGQGEEEGEERSLVSVVVPGGFVRAVEGRGVEEQRETCIEEVDEKERRRDGAPSRVAPPSATTGAASTVLPSQPAASTKPARKRAHRAKFRASKQLASSDAAALSGILGVAQTATMGVPSEAASRTQSALGGNTPAHSPSPAPAPAPAPHNEITRTSTTSVTAYFAAKMRARQLVSATTTATPTTDESGPEAEPELEPELEPEPGAREATLEETTLVDKKEKKKDKKRKRREVVENENEHAVARDGGTAPHRENKKRKKKRKDD